jgi:phosphatidylinositol alpha-1,6-mannosyltransferase
MVAIEAASHGLPTVAFATGGVIDAVKDGVSGYLVEKNDYDSLAKSVTDTLKNPMNPCATLEFAKNFSWHSFGNKVTNALVSIKKAP